MIIRLGIYSTFYRNFTAATQACNRSMQLKQSRHATRIKMNGPLKAHVIKNKHLEQRVSIWSDYFHSFLTAVVQNTPNVSPCTYLKQENYHDDEHFYRTKISIFSTTKNWKINHKRFKMFKMKIKMNFKKFQKLSFFNTLNPVFQAWNTI